jgi:methylmalonyl-CoA epimerase (EC 5.1.99.1)
VPETAWIGMQFAHAGIATDDAAGLAAKYTALFDRPIVHEETIDGMAVVVLGVRWRRSRAT